MKPQAQSNKRWLKAEMHAHCNLDPKDYGICPHSPEQLIREAAGQGFDVLSLTCHDLNIWSDTLAEYARSFGIVLIPGMEVSAEKTRHILVYNFERGPESLNTLANIRKHTRKDTLVVAPHPFFPGPSCIGKYLISDPDLFDAIEYSGFFVPGLNFNNRGVRFAEKTGKPLLGFGDVHHLWQLGKTYSWIYAEPEVDSILNAIRQGTVRMETSPITWSQASGWWADRFWRIIRPVNPPPGSISDKIEDGGRFGTAQEGVKTQRIHIRQQG